MLVNFIIFSTPIYTHASYTWTLDTRKANRIFLYKYFQSMARALVEYRLSLKLEEKKTQKKSVKCFLKSGFFRYSFFLENGFCVSSGAVFM